jgi:hypothetical protein
MNLRTSADSQQMIGRGTEDRGTWMTGVVGGSGGGAAPLPPTI